MFIMFLIETPPVLSDTGDNVLGAKQNDNDQKDLLQYSDVPDETKNLDATSVPCNEVDLSSIKQTPHAFELDFGSLPESDSPIDMLSPISETTEPGSLGNSLNVSTTSSRGIGLPNANMDSGIGCHTKGESPQQIDDKEIMAPTISQTPRILDDHRTSDSVIPRGSYVINSSYTVETAAAAGIPVVERGSIRGFLTNSGTLRGNMGPEHSSADHDVVSAFCGMKPCNVMNGHATVNAHGPIGPGVARER